MGFFTKWRKARSHKKRYAKWSSGGHKNFFAAGKSIGRSNKRKGIAIPNKSSSVANVKGLWG